MNKYNIVKNYETENVKDEPRSSRPGITSALSNALLENEENQIISIV